MTLQRFFLILVALYSFSACHEVSTTTKAPQQIDNVSLEISPDDPKIQYTGRIDLSDPKSPQLFWAGTSIKIKFTGKSIAVKLDDPSGKNFYNAVIDGNIKDRIVIDCEVGKLQYPIVDELADEEHTLEIIRRTDPRNPSTSFKGFVLPEGGKVLNLPSRPELKIEFFGNSITSAHGVLDETRKNNDDLSTWDNTMSYAAMTARRLYAEYHSTSMSGIGIVKSWYPLIMPQIYNRLDPNEAESNWDFSRWTPDIVVVNLFQNDSWLIKNHKGEEMILAYMNFIRSVRSQYPDTEIICALGNMDITRAGSPWPGYVKTAVERLHSMDDDLKIYHLVFPYKATGGHPTVSEHEDMADILTMFIEKELL